MGVKSQAWWKRSGLMVPALKARTFSFHLQTTKVPKKGTEKWEWVVLLLREVTPAWNDGKRARMCVNCACLDAEWSAEFESVPGFNIRWTAEELLSGPVECQSSQVILVIIQLLILKYQSSGPGSKQCGLQMRNMEENGWSRISVADKTWHLGSCPIATWKEIGRW